MKMKKCLSFLAVGVIATVLIVNFSKQQSQEETVLNRLLTNSQADAVEYHFKDAQELMAWRQKYRGFCSLWMARTQRDVTAEIIPYLHDPVMHERVVRALGRLQNPEAQAALGGMIEQPSSDGAPSQQMQLEQEAQNIKPATIPRTSDRLSGKTDPTLSMALSRIRSRNLKGEARVEALAKSVKLSFAQIVRLSQKINSKERAYSSSSLGAKILDEMVDLLYRMSKEGENVDALSERLTLSPAQRMKIRGGKLPLEQEASFLLDFMLHRGTMKEPAGDIKYHFAGLGPRAIELLMERLQDIQRHPEQYPNHQTYVTLFRIVAVVNDRHAIPLLEQFEQDADPYISSTAKTARQDIEQQSSFPIFPA